MSVLHSSNRPTVRATAVDPGGSDSTLQRAAGAAALYLAAAYLVAMPYFLLVVDYQDLVDPGDKVTELAAHQTGMYLVHLASYVVFGIVLVALALALSRRLAGSPGLAAVGGAVGVIWGVTLVASGLVFNYGAGVVVDLQATNPGDAASTWRSVESVAEGLGSGSGELLGGLWVLLVSVAALRTRALPTALNWLGILIGLAGVVSVLPALADARYAFGLLQIVWFVWLGVALLRTRSPGPLPSAPTGAEEIGTA
jgi:hypothetical protein